MVTKTRKKRVGAGKILLIGFVILVTLVIVGVLSETNLDDEESSKQSIDANNSLNQEVAEYSTVEEESVKLASEEIHDAPIKTQIDQRWYVTKVPESEDALKKIIADLHKKARTPRKTFKHHNPANAIYLYVYHDKATAEDERFGAHWLGMSSKSASDSTNQISINSDRLEKQLQPTEVRHGLEEHVRKEIYLAIMNAEKQSREQAEKRFPDDFSEQIDLQDELVQNEREKLMKQHNITDDQLFNISVEGSFEGFH